MPSNENNVRAVNRALAILDCFAQGRASFTLMELARAIDLPPSTTLRLLATLENRNYIYRDSQNLKYYLGFKLAKISHIAFDNLDVCRVARPFLERLIELFDESTGIYLQKGDRRICVDRIEGTKSLRSIVPVGLDLPLTRGASGRVLLANLPPQRAQALLALDPFPTLSELDHVRVQGFAVSHGEREAGVTSVAAPLFDSSGSALAALFVTGPATRFDDRIIESIIREVTDSAGKSQRRWGIGRQRTECSAKRSEDAPPKRVAAFVTGRQPVFDFP